MKTIDIYNQHYYSIGLPVAIREVGGVDGCLELGFKLRAKVRVGLWLQIPLPGVRNPSTYVVSLSTTLLTHSSVFLSQYCTDQNTRD